MAAELCKPVAALMSAPLTAPRRGSHGLGPSSCPLAGRRARPLRRARGLRAQPVRARGGRRPSASVPEAAPSVPSQSCRRRCRTPGRTFCRAARRTSGEKSAATTSVPSSCRLGRPASRSCRRWYQRFHRRLAVRARRAGGHVTGRATRAPTPTSSTSTIPRTSPTYSHIARPRSAAPGPAWPRAGGRRPGRSLAPHGDHAEGIVARGGGGCNWRRWPSTSRMARGCSPDALRALKRHEQAPRPRGHEAPGRMAANVSSADRTQSSVSPRAPMIRSFILP